MNYRKLGDSGLMLSEFGFGCACAWGKSFYKEEDAIRLFFDAVDQGINYFDTGHSYGLSEERLGKCILEMGPEKRKDLIISTKCGTRLDSKGKHYKDWSVDWLKQSVALSMERMHIDYIDMLNLHSPSLKVITDDVWHLLEDLKSQKVVRTVGASCMNAADNKKAVTNSVFDFVMISYNLMMQQYEPVIQALAQNGKGVIAGEALAKTLYSNDVFKVRNVTDLWYLLRAFANNRHFLKRRKDFSFVNKVENATGNQVALRYVLENPNITSAVFGTTSKAHLLENIQAADIDFPEELKQRIQQCK